MPLDRPAVPELVALVERLEERFENRALSFKEVTEGGALEAARRAGQQEVVAQIRQWAGDGFRV